jgi:hypothetical protein
MGTICLVSGWLWRCVLDKIKSSSTETKKLSFPDLITEGSFIKINKHYDKWQLNNVSIKDQIYFKDFGIDLAAKI